MLFINRAKDKLKTGRNDIWRVIYYANGGNCPAKRLFRSAKYSTSLSLTEIAYECGFSDLSHLPAALNN